jgi:hypothetical protein
MTVKQLINKLKKFDEDLKVFVSDKDIKEEIKVVAAKEGELETGEYAVFILH